jgi:mRNA interferase RelE/StbE
MAKRYVTQYTAKARKDLLRCDKLIAQRIVKKVMEYSKMQDPLERAKPLTGNLSGAYRYRVGDYRVLFDVVDGKEIHILMVIRIKHRKDVYKI